MSVPVSWRLGFTTAERAPPSILNAAPARGLWRFVKRSLAVVEETLSIAVSLRRRRTCSRTARGAIQLLWAASVRLLSPCRPRLRRRWRSGLSICVEHIGKDRSRHFCLRFVGAALVAVLPRLALAQAPVQHPSPGLPGSRCLLCRSRSAGGTLARLSLVREKAIIGLRWPIGARSERTPSAACLACKPSWEPSRSWSVATLGRVIKQRSC